MDKVLMHKETGQLYELVVGGVLGDFLVWEDCTTEDKKHLPITRDSLIYFDDEPEFDLSQYEDLGVL